MAAGVDEVWIDPGFGFGKTLDHNLALLAHLDELVATGFPVAVGPVPQGLPRPPAGRERRRAPAAPALPGLVGVGIADDDDAGAGRRPHRGFPRRGDVGRACRACA